MRKQADTSANEGSNESSCLEKQRTILSEDKKTENDGQCTRVVSEDLTVVQSQSGSPPKHKETVRSKSDNKPANTLHPPTSPKATEPKSEVQTSPAISSLPKGKIPNPESSVPSQPEQTNNSSPINSGPRDVTIGNAKPNASVGSVYRDYSRLPCAQDANVLMGTSTSSCKEPPFPVKLHKILSNPENSDIISWLPHGRSWRVLKPKTYEEKIIPKYFRHAKYASFMRQVNGWGFKRMTQGPDHNSYYHELFLRGLPHLCLKMRRPTRAKAGSSDSDINPDFYRLSMVAPLPNPENSVAKDGSYEGIHDLGVARCGALANMANTPSALGLQTHAMSVGGIPNNFSNLGVKCFNGSNLSANALLQQQVQRNINPALTSAGTLVTSSGANNALNIPSINSDMSQHIEALRQRREDIVRQLQIINNGHGNDSSYGANRPISVPEQTGLLHNPDAMSSQAAAMSQNLTPNLNHGDLLSSNPSATSGQLQQMMSQLQDSGFNMATGNFGNHQSLGGIGMYSTGNIPGAVVGGAVSNVNQQLLLQHNLSTNPAYGTIELNGMNNALASPSLGNLGFMMQNQMINGQRLNGHIFNGSSQVLRNPNSSLNFQANPRQATHYAEITQDSNGNSNAEKKIK